MALHRPGLAPIPRLVEAENVVVALGTDKPLARGDDVIGMVGVDSQVRLRVIVDEHRAGRGVAVGATDLVRIGPGRTGVFAGGGTRARGHAGIAVSRPFREEWHLGSIAAHLLTGNGDIAHLGLGIAGGIGRVARPAWPARARTRLDRHDGEGDDHEEWHADREQAMLLRPHSLPKTTIAD